VHRQQQLALLASPFLLLQQYPWYAQQVQQQDLVKLRQQLTQRLQPGWQQQLQVEAVADQEVMTVVQRAQTGAVVQKW